MSNSKPVDFFGVDSFTLWRRVNNKAPENITFTKQPNMQANMPPIFHANPGNWSVSFVDNCWCLYQDRKLVARHTAGSRRFFVGDREGPETWHVVEERLVHPAAQAFRNSARGDSNYYHTNVSSSGSRDVAMDSRAPRNNQAPRSNQNYYHTNVSSSGSRSAADPKSRRDSRDRMDEDYDRAKREEYSRNQQLRRPRFQFACQSWQGFSPKDAGLLAKSTGYGGKGGGSYMKTCTSVNIDVEDAARFIKNQVGIILDAEYKNVVDESINKMINDASNAGFLGKENAKMMSLDVKSTGASGKEIMHYITIMVAKSGSPGEFQVAYCSQDRSGGFQKTSKREIQAMKDKMALECSNLIFGSALGGSGRQNRDMLGGRGQGALPSAPNDNGSSWNPLKWGK